MASSTHVVGFPRTYDILESSVQMPFLTNTSFDSASEELVVRELEEGDDEVTSRLLKNVIAPASQFELSDSFRAETYTTAPRARLFAYTNFQEQSSAFSRVLGYRLLFCIRPREWLRVSVSMEISVDSPYWALGARQIKLMVLGAPRSRADYTSRSRQCWTRIPIYIRIAI